MFRDLLDQLQTIHDDQWTSLNVRVELSKALGTIDNARAEFQRACAKLECLAPKQLAPVVSEEDKAAAEFRRYIKLGFAASLPLIVAGTIWLIISIIVKH
jgi:hypothetical protein